MWIQLRELLRSWVSPLLHVTTCLKGLVCLTSGDSSLPLGFEGASPAIGTDGHSLSLETSGARQRIVVGFISPATCLAECLGRSEPGCNEQATPL
jgi:hypothetical protein